MQFLERLTQVPSASWYAVRGDWEGRIVRYVVSTPPSRDICNRPEVLGVEFNLKLQDAMAAAFGTAPFRRLIEEHPEDRVCVVNFLRGGLNFEIRRALQTAYGFNRHSSAFMSSQRYREDGRWYVKEDMYRKLEIPSDAVLVMGDVVATGVTMENGLKVILEHISDLGSSIRALVFFTIGCHKAEKVLEEVDAEARERFPGYQKTILVYLEGKFRLVDSKTELRIGIPGTDLIRKDALLAPELERSMYQSVPYFLERCAIYDAGSRAFDIPTYLGDVIEYWTKVAKLSEGGFTLGEAIEERWPPHHRWFEAKRAQWHGLDDAFLEDQHARWNKLLAREDLGTPEALAEVCRERLDTLRKVGGIVREDR
ncbi:MAG: phosphoribosyltransferase [Deltaproteobacteria bacterium]|nr:phosphoribosyltransferase [Deltaproteobacteria bacterium]MBW2254255.1 phosphoribosyltransferase [Deltaproteobacteria bacterium]